MTEYSLIKQLQNPKKVEKTPLPKGINYSKQTVIVEGKEKVVNIPSKEIERFKFMIEENGPKISTSVFNHILREVRGIRD